MATMIPDPPLDFHGSPGEQEAFEALRALPERCFVFHSVRWIGEVRHQHEAAMGEGDLVVFDPERGLLVIEVKSGAIRFHRGRWSQSKLDGSETYPMQDPEAQANRTRYQLIKRLKERLPPDACCPVYHAVWFPSARFAGPAPQNLPPAMVLDVESLGDTNQAIDRAFAFGSGKPQIPKLSSREARQVLDLIAPELYAAPSMRHAIQARERTFLRLTAEQARVLDFLDEQDRAVVAGAAGTGKTMVALQLARRLAGPRSLVTFLCFNSALRKFLELYHAIPYVEFHTFDSLARQYSDNQEVSFADIRDEFLERADSSAPPEFDHLIIDEAQDFEDHWVAALEQMSKGKFYVFYDRNQLIQRERLPSWLESADCRLVLRRNCRTTTQIATFASRCAPGVLHFPTPSIDGDKPCLYECLSRGDAIEKVQQILQHLLGDKEYDLHDIAVLTTRSLDRSSLRWLTQESGIPTNDVPKKEHLTVSTVRQFKGLEARAVILVDISLSDLADESVRSLAYVGSSRAMQELHVILTGCDKAATMLAARSLFPDRSRMTIKSLASALGARWAMEKKHAEVVD